MRRDCITSMSADISTEHNFKVSLYDQTLKYFTLQCDWGIIHYMQLEKIHSQPSSQISASQPSYKRNKRYVINILVFKLKISKMKISEIPQFVLILNI